MTKKLVVLSGAGVSAESGIKTFRDSDGLWENYNVRDVATPEGYYRDRQLVLDFYNARRAQLETAKPNRAHQIIAEIESYFDVTVITQNIDNLHEQAGSTHVIHLHGEATKVVPEDFRGDPIDVGYRPVNLGDVDRRGVQLRPFIVWFGENVPNIVPAAREVETADIVLVIGTSLQVYPAAGLVSYAPSRAKIYLIDPQPIHLSYNNFKQIQAPATKGMAELREILLKDLGIK